MSLFEGATATSPMDTVASLSSWCSKVTPLFVVFSRPPEAGAIQYVVGSASHTARAVMRPPMLAGPMQRQLKELTQLSGRVPFWPIGDVLSIFAVSFGLSFNVSLGASARG